VLNFLQEQLKKIFTFHQEKQFVIGHVLECEKIENTHLHKTKVDVGNGKILDIVCGAKNIAKNQYVVVALPGA
jgi:phenylalanyl-tRNA synthetase beta chain